MPCFKPIEAWQTEDGKVVFVERGRIKRPLTLPCGRCIGCRLERSRQWAVRCMHESQMHPANCFVTLTYDEEHLPMWNDLVYPHFQDFMKRLRWKMGAVRFYMCGEYGEQYGRPHFHACLFGVDFTDKLLFKKGVNPGCDLYTSDTLSKLWTLGFASVGQLSFDSAAYVARYVMKKALGETDVGHLAKLDLSTGELYNCVPEFNRMSLKPGIGASWLQKYKSDVYPRDFVIVNGSKAKPPRFYDKKLTVMDPATAEFVEFVRYRQSLDSSDDCSPDRLRAREICTRARIASKIRSLE